MAHPPKLYPGSRSSSYFTLHIHPTWDSLNAIWNSPTHKRTIPLKSCSACCITYRPPSGRALGAIHLPSPSLFDGTTSTFGATAAHECLHAALYWQSRRLLKGNRCSEEDLCTALQRMLDQIYYLDIPPNSKAPLLR